MPTRDDMTVRDMVQGFKLALDLIGPHPSRAILNAKTDGALITNQSVMLILGDSLPQPRSACRDEILISHLFVALVRHTIRPARREDSLLDALDDHRRILRMLHSSKDLNRTGIVLFKGWTPIVFTTDGDYIERRLRFEITERVDLTEQAQ